MRSWLAMAVAAIALALPAAAASPEVTLDTAASPRAVVALAALPGVLPLAFEPAHPVRFDRTEEVVIEGTVEGTTPAAVALRIDDTQSTSYATRFNDERTIPPGPFRFSVGLGGLRTPSGRALDTDLITRVILFAWQGAPHVAIARFEVREGAAMPAGAHGYAFGGPVAPLPAGFERIAPGDTRIAGRREVRAIRRPAPDPLVANGLTGIDHIVLPAPAPMVHVTVWSEDPGEWEVLPHPLERRITVNGAVLVAEKLTVEQWIGTRYLRGVAAEHTAADDAWTAFGQFRGAMAAIDVAAGPEGVVIELDGGSPEAHFINAVVVEPAIADTAATPAGQAFAIAERASWYRTNFPVVAGAPTRDPTAFEAQLRFDAAGAASRQLRIALAPGTGRSVHLDVTSDRRLDRPAVSLAPPQRASVALGMRAWAEQLRLERDNSVLRLTADRLVADLSALPVEPGKARGYDLWIDAPENAPAGDYEGSLSFGLGSERRTIPIVVSVIDVHLPETKKPAGFYLARAPHLAMFPGLAAETDAQVRCDLEFLRGFGLTNTAPPIAGIDRPNLAGFAADMHRAATAGVAPGWLVYNPLTALIEAQGVERAAETMRRVNVTVRAQQLPEPLWSVADEPSNPDPGAPDVAALVAKLRERDPAIRLAGHLNAPGDSRYVPLFDTVLINPGFGIDAGRIEATAKANSNGAGPKVWLYNTFAPRQTAGLWLWRTAAERYLQWHARMPTADPFDPLDGREGDFQAIYPGPGYCARQPDIHRDLLAMADGVVDQRWLLWLDRRTDTASRRLAAEIKSLLPGSFDDARAMTEAQLDAMRSRIETLAGGGG